MKKLEMIFEDFGFKKLALDEAQIGKGIFAINIQIRSADPKVAIQIIGENGIKDYAIDTKFLKMDVCIENKKESS